MKKGDLRVWWISNPPRDPFLYPVKSLEEAKKVMSVLAKYDLYLGSLISVNACNVEVFEGEEWCNYYDEEGRGFEDIINDAMDDGWRTQGGISVLDTKLFGVVFYQAMVKE